MTLLERCKKWELNKRESCLHTLDVLGIGEEGGVAWAFDPRIDEDKMTYVILVDSNKANKEVLGKLRMTAVTWS